MALRKRKEVIKYVSSDPDLQEWIRDFAKHLKTHPDKNVVQYPESFARGYARVFEVSEGISCRMVDYTLNTDFLFERAPSKDFYLILYFYNYRNCHRLDLQINKRVVIENEDSDYSSLLMTNSLAGQTLKLTRGTAVRGLTIQLSQQWVQSRLKSSSKLNIKRLYDKDIFQTMIKPRYRTLINEIFSVKTGSYVPELYLSSRVYKLLELFFDEIFRNGLDANVLPASSRDVQSLLVVEEYLLQHYREPFPTIHILSRMAMMSSSKLKQVFKKAFGMSLFDYYQQNRMEKAREMLLSDLYSVTEVGSALGYQNLSNFSVAFKKKFGVLPKDAGEIA